MRWLRTNKESFLKYLDQFKGYSDLTVRSYDDAIEEMIENSEFTVESNKTIINLMPLRVKISKQNPKTISRKLSAIRSFVKYLQMEGNTIELMGDESIKVPKTLPKPISHAHILEVMNGSQPLAKLAIILLYSMGLRISELSSLEYSHLGKEWCRVIGKGSKQRDIPMLPYVFELIEKERQKNGNKQFVFESGGRKLSENSLRYIITKAFEQRGIKATPHQLRHAYATELLNNNARIADVSELLGHASMATTQIYTKLGNALKMDHYRSSHPLCKEIEESDKC